MEPHERVTVALARAEADRELLEYARCVADQRSVEFQFVHVLDWPAAASDPATVVGYDQARAEIISAVGRYFPQAGADCRILTGRSSTGCSNLRSRSRAISCSLVTTGDAVGGVPWPAGSQCRRRARC